MESTPLFMLFEVVIRAHVHGDSSRAGGGGNVRTGPLANLFSPSFFALSHRCVKRRALDSDVDTSDRRCHDWYASSAQSQTLSTR